MVCSYRDIFDTILMDDTKCTQDMHTCYIATYYKNDDGVAGVVLLGYWKTGFIVLLSTQGIRMIKQKHMDIRCANKSI